MNRIGLHFRLNGSLYEIAQRAVQFNLDFFQCFFVLQSTGRRIQLSHEEVEAFKAIRKHRFTNLYMHGSYWINLASLRGNGYTSFKRETELAKQLAFTHVILHAGSAQGATDKNQGISVLAHMLNRILYGGFDLQIVLENSAHGNLCVGSDITDFSRLLEQVDKPELIQFCIDTSHAYAYGYNIADDQQQDEFVELLDNTIGLEKIVLIHLNDTKERLGSRIDRHEIPGNGRIGEHALKRFMMNPRLVHARVIMELPIISEDVEFSILQKIRSWNK